MLPTIVETRFSAYLDRKAVPRHIAEKPQQVVAAVEALLRVVRANAPPTASETWWQHVEDRLEVTAKTQAWPIASEIAEACKHVNAEWVKPAARSSDLPAEIEHMARRMNAGEAVAESALYGVNAVQLRRAGLVDEATLRRYRSAAYFARKAAYSREEADRWQAECEAHHEDVAASWDDHLRQKALRDRPGYGAAVPAKAMPGGRFDA